MTHHQALTDRTVGSGGSAPKQKCEEARSTLSVDTDPRLRADDGIRTRDPHLGKVMRYQLRYVRVGENNTGSAAVLTHGVLSSAAVLAGAG